MSILYDSRLLKRLCRAQYRLACLYLSFILHAPYLSSHTAIEQFQRIAVYLFAIFMTTAFDLTISVIHMGTAFLASESSNATPASIGIRSPVCRIYSSFFLLSESDRSFFSSTGAQYTSPSRIKYHRLPTIHWCLATRLPRIRQYRRICLCRNFIFLLRPVLFSSILRVA